MKERYILYWSAWEDGSGWSYTEPIDTFDNLDRDPETILEDAQSEFEPGLAPGKSGILHIWDREEGGYLTDDNDNEYYIWCRHYDDNDD